MHLHAYLTNSSPCSKSPSRSASKRESKEFRFDFLCEYLQIYEERKMRERERIWFIDRFALDNVIFELVLRGGIHIYIHAGQTDEKVICRGRFAPNDISKRSRSKQHTASADATRKEQVLRKEHWSETCFPFRQLWRTDIPNDRPTNRRTDR